MKRILGLDLGTNSIGWAVVQSDEDTKELKGIEAAGSRIIPMDSAQLGDFAKGNTVSQTKDRTQYRGVRRIRERSLLRRERLHRVLALLGFLPKHYAESLTRYGQFKDNVECKLPWVMGDDGSWRFLFKDSFDEMLSDFRAAHPDMQAKVPYDWTIYYLRKKALHEAISRQELAWILLNFNQKRGYYQLRGEDEQTEEQGKLSEYYALKVVAVEDTGERKGKDTWYNIHLENGMVYRRSASVCPDWVGKVKEFIVTTDLDKDGTPKKDKDGNIKRSFRMPKEDDWTLLKKKTELDIESSDKEIGEYIYDALLQNPMRKIRGKLVRTVERKFYKRELEAILEVQERFIPELRDRELYAACLDELYGNNDAYRQSVASHDLKYLLVKDIIFYQRPLKSKKSLIDDCPYETFSYKDKATGEVKHAPIKCIAKSNPLFQEFRLWQFVQNMRIYEKQRLVNGLLKTDVDITGEVFPTEEDRVRLFDYLNTRETISQDTLFGTYLKVKKNEDKEYPYRWNYVEDKSYPCNETRAAILNSLKKAGVNKDFLDKEKEQHLWHILYSVDDKQELNKAIAKFALRHGLPDAFVEAACRIKPFKKEYGAYSAKAIKRLLPLMRMGGYWGADAIDDTTKGRIDKIITGEYDETIKNRVREKALHLREINDFRGLPLWLACYIVYDRHSEARDIEHWQSPADIDKYLSSFRQHSLRNPIVEQVILETLRIVRDVWKTYGKIDEIHVELSREMKNPADKRKQMAARALENEATNLRIKAMLTDFLNPELDVEDVRPYSPSQQELLRIYEDGVLSSVSEIPDDISAIIRKFSQAEELKRPTLSEVKRYKLWLEQKYVSPYTGRPIPLGKLFTTAYEIEHIIPQSRYFDDSFSNKVICESEVNKLKDRMLGLEFIKAHHGEKVQLSMGGEATILSEEEYQRLAQDTYKGNRAKLKKLLMDDIPDKFIERQLNDSRYISKVIISLLSNLVRTEGEAEAVSRNVITCTGTITDCLKRDWGVKDVWNHIIMPRFERLNEMKQTQVFTKPNGNGHMIPSVPLDLQKGFTKKRIDHRHHAMDAIVIACATRNHVNLLNNEAALSSNNLNRDTLSRKLRHNGLFVKPWATFTNDVERALSGIVVSFKQNLRVINKTTNKTQKVMNGRKTFVPQVKGDSWAIRKSMHKETVFGEVNLRRIKDVPLKEALDSLTSIVDKELKNKLKDLVAAGYDAKRIKAYFEANKDTWSDVNLKKIGVYYFTKDTKERFFATRKPLDVSFSEKKICESVTDTGVQEILLRHLSEHDNNPELAFSPDGIERMNQNMLQLNDGKKHQPILKVRVYEKAEKFAVGQRGNKASKFVEAAKGTNLFYAVYETEQKNKNTGLTEKKRSYATIPLNVVISRQKQGLPSAPADERGNSPAFVLSPNDLVYLPTKEECERHVIEKPIDKRRIYKMVSCTGLQCMFVPCSVANTIVDKYEFSPLNKMERAITGEMIKETCVPLKVDRLGNIIELNGERL